MLSPSEQCRMPRLDDLRGVLTPSSREKGLTKLSLKFRDQKLSLTPRAVQSSTWSRHEKSVDSDNFDLQDGSKMPVTSNGKTNVSCVSRTAGSVSHLPNEDVAALNAACEEEKNHYLPRNRMMESFSYTMVDSPNVFNKALTSIVWSDESTDELEPKNEDTCIVISDSDEPGESESDEQNKTNSDDKKSQSDCFVSTSSCVSDSRDLAFLCTPSTNNSVRSRYISSTASASSSRKLQVLRNIVSSSDEEANCSPRPLVERISRIVPKQDEALKSNASEGPASQDTWSRREPTSMNDSSDDDDDVFEKFLEKFKTPVRTPRVCLEQKLEAFIISDDNCSSEDDDNLLHLRINNSSVKTAPLKPTESDQLNVFAKPHIRSRAKTFGASPVALPPSTKQPRSLSHSLPRFADGQSTKPGLSFVSSLSTNANPALRDCQAARYVKEFKKLKTELVAKLYSIFNEKIFENKLPKDMKITWNARLTATAGYCYTKTELSGTRIARLELSTKVLDCTERVRDTIIHELCHAATWLINGVRDGHGRYWKYWARLAQIKFPELPPVSRCHTYHVTTKYTYQCKKCNYSIGRHSKSLDISKKVCGRCHGQFELLVNSTPSKSPRTTSKFALFVKENYHQVKSSNELKAHADVMQSLSREFAKNRIADGL